MGNQTKKGKKFIFLYMYTYINTLQLPRANFRKCKGEIFREMNKIYSTLKIARTKFKIETVGGID